jgi:asparagine synthase (glutamine-hydrolysing)
MTQARTPQDGQIAYNRHLTGFANKAAEASTIIIGIYVTGTIVLRTIGVIDTDTFTWMMCGISGIWKGTDLATGGRRINSMLETIVHRGPDGYGRLDRPGLAMGMRRLAIIDLAGGDQPIYNEDLSVGVVFNGEIYNFRELRSELERQGHRFATRTDTEVLVHAYEQWGDDMLHRLVGMFAFALWDERHRRLLVARDRFGKKPLYYMQHGDELVFGSEIKALLAAGVPVDLDDAALEEYLALRYVPAPRTLFRGIRQLPAGHKMVAGDNGLEVERWWRLHYGPKLPSALTRAADDIEDLMRVAVARRLVSDVSLGCFLSGGLDSSTVLSFMAELSDEPVRTFSIGFDQRWAPDELPAARSTAQAFGTHHQETRLGQDEFLRLIPTAVWHRDEPLAEPSEIPLLALSRMAREHVTVVLSGEGGDELFGGYPKYPADAVLSRTGRPARAILGEHRLRELAGWHHLPRRARMAIEALATADPGERWPRWFGADRQARLSSDGVATRISARGPRCRPRPARHHAGTGRRELPGRQPGRAGRQDDDGGID